MGKPRRAFSDEFKRQAVRRVGERTAIGVTRAQIGRELGVGPELLRRWERWAAAAERGAGGPAGGAADGEEVVTLAELRRLRRENETLRQERDFAKKAAAFFAREVR
jgi:transposase